MGRGLNTHCKMLKFCANAIARDEFTQYQTNKQTNKVTNKQRKEKEREKGRMEGRKERVRKNE